MSTKNEPILENVTNVSKSKKINEKERDRMAEVLRTPDGIHPAFNNVNFLLESAGIEEINVFVQALYPVDKEFRLVIDAVAGDNIVELRGVVSKFFRDAVEMVETPDFTGWAFDDFRIKSAYRALNIGFTALNMSTPYGKTLWEYIKNPVLLPHTQAEEYEIMIPKYRGYPYGVSVLAHPDYESKLNDQLAYIVEVLVTRDNMTVEIPYYSELQSTATFGDGGTTSFMSDAASGTSVVTHTYGAPGIYEVKIYPDPGASLTAVGSVLDTGNAHIYRILQFPPKMHAVHRFHRCVALTEVNDYPRPGISVIGYIASPNVGIGIFSECVELTYVHPLFLTAYENIDLPFIANSMFDGDIKLEEIDEDFFSYATIYDFTNVLKNTGLRVIPAGIFRYNVEAEIFQSAFYGIPAKELPEGVFDYNVNAKNFTSTFAMMVNLETAIGVGRLFFKNCPDVETFAYLFYGCKELRSVASGIFSIHKKCRDYSFAFGMTSIAVIGKLTQEDFRCDGRFLYNNAGLAGFPAEIIGTGCYFNQTGMSRYDRIPDGWK